MPSYSQQRYCEHLQQNIYSLVLDIAQYPKFLPWCTSAEVISREDGKIIADLEVQFSGFKEKYRSLVEHFVCDDVYVVKTTMLDGPFEYLNSCWNISKDDVLESKVDFTIDVKVKSGFFNHLIELFFASACKKIVTAFEERANELFQRDLG